MFAPKSSTTLKFFLFGQRADNAGLSIFSIISKFNFDNTKRAPVFPADIATSDSLFFKL